MKVPFTQKKRRIEKSVPAGAVTKVETSVVARGRERVLKITLEVLYVLSKTELHEDS